LTSIALSPLSVPLAPGKSAQLTVTGTYSDSSTATLDASNEQFSTSDASVATVSAAGVVTVAATAAVGTTATITATDTASGLKTAASVSTIVTVLSTVSVGPPTQTSVDAVTSTAANDAACTQIEPYYWEFGDQSGLLASGSVGVDSAGAAILRTTRESIASASKWIYGIYVLQKRGGVSGLSQTDISFLHFTSGYTNMGVDTTGATCIAPPGGGTNSINYCLTLSSASGAPYDGQNQSTIGAFDYDAGHLENHAGQFQPEINALDTTALGPAIVQELLGPSSTVDFTYTQPLLAGGIYTSAADYAQVLQAVVAGQLLMHDALGTNQVCAWTGSSSCNAAFSPVAGTHWNYSMAHWVESPEGDGSFSSPGAFGFYPWIDSTKTYYGLISRDGPSGQGLQQGVASAQCGALLRKAWTTGVAQ
jgi:hypothetical protein